MRKLLIPAARGFQIDVGDDVEGQVLVELSRDRVHGGQGQLAAFAPAVVHAFQGIDLEFLAANLHRACHPAGHVEVAFPSLRQARFGDLFFGGSDGMRGVLGIMNIERIHDPVPVDMDLGVVIAHVVDPEVSRRVHRTNFQSRGRVDVGEPLGRRKMHLAVDVQHLRAVVGQRSKDVDVVQHHSEDGSRCDINHHQQVFFRDRDREDVGLGPLVVGVCRGVVFEVLGGDHGNPLLCGFEGRTMESAGAKTRSVTGLVWKFPVATCGDATNILR